MRPYGSKPPQMVAAGDLWNSGLCQRVRYNRHRIVHTLTSALYSPDFADPPPPPPDLSHLSLTSPEDRPKGPPEEVVPTSGAPTTLIQWAVLILNTADPSLKVSIQGRCFASISTSWSQQVQRTRHAVNLFRTGQLKSIGHRVSSPPQPPDVPPREDLYSKNMVDPRTLGKRKSRPVMLHALANIEQWA